MNKKKKTPKALREIEGINPPSHISTQAANAIINKRRSHVATNVLIQGILEQNKTHLSRAITLIESSAPKHQNKAKEIINACLPYANNSIRIGITGVPGVGKSSFIEKLGLYLIQQQKKVAVLAVDPSSTISKGSILGDKTRMEQLVQEPNAYIRPSASGDALGGVARKTREAIILCEAAGYDVIIIETVGVGQSETAVHSMTDFFLLLKLAGAGDELQGIKRGIMEMADAILINKADGDTLKAAKLAKVSFQRALHLYPQKDNGWTPKTLTGSALLNQGIKEFWETVQSFLTLTKNNNSFADQRKAQNKYWLLQTIDAALKTDFYRNPILKDELNKQLRLLEENKTTPFEAADLLLAKKRSL